MARRSWRGRPRQALALLAMAALPACGSSLALDLLDGGSLETADFGRALLDDVNDRRYRPGACATDADCADGDPCTVDSCSDRHCRFDLPAGLALEALYTLPTATAALDLDMTGEYVFIAEGTSGVRVLDIRDRQRISVSAVLPTRGPALGVDIGSLGIAVAEGSSGFETFSWTGYAPAGHFRPHLGVLDELEDTVTAVALGPSFSIVTGYVDGLVVLGFGDLGAPALLAWLDTRGRAVGAAAANPEWGLVADSLGGTAVVLFRGGAPELGPILVTEGRVVDVAVNRDAGLAAEWGAGLSLLDVNDAATAQRLARLTTRAPVAAVTLLGPFSGAAVLADGTVGLLDLRAGRAPRAISTWHPPAGTIGRAISGRAGLVAVALDSAGTTLFTTGCRGAEVQRDGLK